MGLCKCPKKKVTNLFCFEHKVNVCEHCLVTDHERCSIRSYLQWLQDCDFVSDCQLCGGTLKENPVLRLTCHDLFHVTCLDSFARSLPLNTAPAGYQCPACQSGIFPPANLVSPVADGVRRILADFRWAKAGLGLPFLATQPPPLDFTTDLDDTNDTLDLTDLDTSGRTAEDAAIELELAMAQATAKRKNVRSAPTLQIDTNEPDAGATPFSHAHPTESLTSRKETTSLTEQQTFDSGGYRHPAATMTSGTDSIVRIDPDENKYKRRSPLELLGRWLGLRLGGKQKRRVASSSSGPNFRRWIVLLLLSVLALVTIILILRRASLQSSDDLDDLLDPMNNPNIKVGPN